MDAQTLSDIMGGTLSLSRYQELLPGYENAARAAQINNLERAAQWAAQLGHESVGLRYMEEIADGSAYNGRADLGNTQPGDGPRFKGRGPIQLTGRNNYRAFTRWANASGHTGIDFEAEPHRLSEPHWGFLAASYYWTVARPGINAAADQGYTLDVTRMINGGTNGIDDRRARYNRAKAMGNRIIPGQGGPTVQAVEKVLDYSRDQIHQDTFYNCGPASTQTVVKAAGGGFYGEAQLGRELGTHTGGTDYIGQFPKVLNKYLPKAGYRHVDMPNDPPTAAQKERLWQDIVNSINAGYGVIANIVAPPSNYPRAVAPSTQSPAYAGGTVYHYFAVMGFSEAGGRRVWIADSGFSPFGYWMGFDQLATLIPNKGYAYSTAAPLTGGITVDQADRIIDYISKYVGPNNSDTKDIRFQLTGSRDSIPGDVLASYPGFEQLGQNADGNNLTVTDAIAALRLDNAEMRKEIAELRDLLRKLVKK